MRFVLAVLGNLFHKAQTVCIILVNCHLQRQFHKNIGAIGQNVLFVGISKITGLSQIEIGDNVVVGENACIRGEGGLSVGDNCHFSRNLVIYTHSHNYDGSALPYDDTFRFRKVTIERNVWVGMNVTILPGAHIKEGAIIGAAAVVAGTVEPLAIVGAAVAHPIKYRDKEHYDTLESERRYCGPNGVPLDPSTAEPT